MQDSPTSPVDRISSPEPSVSNGKVAVSNGKAAVSNGNIAVSNGKVAVYNSKTTVPNGKIAVTNGKIAVPNGKAALSNDRIAVSNDKVAHDEGSNDEQMNEEPHCEHIEEAAPDEEQEEKPHDKQCNCTSCTKKYLDSCTPKDEAWCRENHMSKSPVFYNYLLYSARLAMFKPSGLFLPNEFDPAKFCKDSDSVEPKDLFPRRLLNLLPNFNPIRYVRKQQRLHGPRHGKQLLGLVSFLTRVVALII